MFCELQHHKQPRLLTIRMVQQLLQVLHLHACSHTHVWDMTAQGTCKGKLERGQG